ncbi:MFS transporter [Rathayibacter toxicus]|uniref:MFS transporter n=1 Tax=Rathayibacter toxicus TaxID=145458 RepID=A0A0C5BTV3_9MICO|nr:MFS transporter [Rathayibacter toxicus]AJM78062.1 major facilitator transporter [Rathayibacter toxicus]ALS57701.1 MFS transporter [Rathayibacter toxicus]KKM47285.1 major facilitator transporter [Rathayibacter toxicus]PPG20628.1 MFS transporter [Rathayibacter toxicus]PPG45732.1 MFS transporter [Rathayibacter toxicus]
MSSSTAAPNVALQNTRGRVIFASLIGTSIEFYDFYAYGTAAVLVFPTLFFAYQTPATALLSSFAVFGVAFIARPVGAIIFGHFGDRIGRKGTLFISLLTMGIATALIGCLPTALTPGWDFLAPTALVVLRFCQGIGLGGEWSGATLLATENAPAHRRAVYGSFPQLGAPIGFLLANALFLLLTATMDSAAFANWGWRIPFLASAILVLVGLYVRFQLVETPAFRKVMEKGEVAKLPLSRVIVSSWRPLILGTFITLATYVIFYLMTTFTLTYGTTPTTEKYPGLGYPRQNFLIMLIVSVVFFGIFTLVSGLLAEKYGRRKTLLGVSTAILVFGFLFVPLLGGGFAGVMAMLIVGFTLTGLSFGPMGAALPELFPANVRYTGSAISYNMASVIGAAPAPTIAVALWQAADGSPVLVGLYLSGMALVTLIALVFFKETQRISYVDGVS